MVKIKRIIQKNKPKPSRKRGTNMRRRNNRSQGPRTPLLPLSVNNSATVPRSAKSFRMIGEEYAGLPISFPGNVQLGTIIFNRLITPGLCPRLFQQSKCWQRYTVNSIRAKMVTLNGSLVTSGYTMALIDDPSFPVRTDSKGIINLTAFEGSTIRQNWVMSSVSNSTKNGERPPMFVTQTGDPRLYSPGRIVVQLNGVPQGGGTEVSWALVLSYDITFHIAGVVSDPTDNINFDPIWSNNAPIGNTPAGPGLQSSANTQGLDPITNYYTQTPSNVAMVVNGTSTVRWVVGFRTGSIPSQWNTHLAITSIDPNNPSLDTPGGVTPVGNLGELIWFTGVGFSTTRPVYPAASLSLEEVNPS